VIYFAFPSRTHISATDAPNDLNAIWLKTSPASTYKIKGDFLLEAEVSAEDFSKQFRIPELTTIHGFNSNPELSFFNINTGSWTEITEDILGNWILPIKDESNILIIRQAYEANLTNKGILEVR